jgi:hypothetical protein
LEFIAIDNTTMVDVGTVAMTLLLPAINILQDPEIVWQ